MKRFLIQDARVGISRGGFACGPVPGNVIAEVTLQDNEGNTTNHCLVEVDGTLNFYESDTSIFKGLLDEDFDNPHFIDLLENAYIDSYESYYDFYEEVNSVQPISIFSQIRKYLAYMVRASWAEANRFKEKTIGKTVDEIDIPVCDEEADYLELTESDQVEEEDQTNEEF